MKKLLTYMLIFTILASLHGNILLAEDSMLPGNLPSSEGSLQQEISTEEADPYVSFIVETDLSDGLSDAPSLGEEDLPMDDLLGDATTGAVNTGSTPNTGDVPSTGGELPTTGSATEVEMNLFSDALDEEAQITTMDAIPSDPNDIRWVWKVGANERVCMDAAANSTFQYEEDWGDGTTGIWWTYSASTIADVIFGNNCHTYTTAGEYEVTIKGGTNITRMGSLHADEAELQSIWLGNTPHLEEILLGVNVSNMFTIDGLTPQTLRGLYFRGNNIESLSSSFLSKFPDLESFHLKKNNITSLPESFFSSTPHLRILELEENKISSLPTGIFNGLTDLTQLYLHDNQITTLPGGAFSSLSNLTELSISDNPITQIERGVFSGLSSLTSITLSNLPLQSLPLGALEGLQNLKNLQLCTAIPTSLEASAFSGLSNLKSLMIGICNEDYGELLLGSSPISVNGIYKTSYSLQQLSAGAFQGLANLELLYVHGSFDSLPEGLLDPVPSLIRTRIVGCLESGSVASGTLARLQTSRDPRVNIRDSQLACLGPVTYSPTTATTGPVTATLGMYGNPTKRATLISTYPSLFTQIFTENGTGTFDFSGITSTHKAYFANLPASETKEAHVDRILDPIYAPCASVTDVPLQECKALVDFYHSTNGDQWTKGFSGDIAANRPWLKGSSACSWRGLTCSTTSPKHVTTVNLSDNNLSGRLNPSLGQLHEMKIFYIHQNNIGGTLPKEYGAWSKLEYFHAHLNHLSGVLPEEYANWENIKNFAVMGNNLEGELPSSYGDSWKNIVLFRIQNNAIDGAIPESYCQWTGLSHFSISANALEGTLPDACIQSFHNTRILELGNNNLDLSKIKLDDVPMLFPNVMDLNLGKSKISGTFSSSWQNLTGLRYLDVANNKISGTVPDFFQDYPWISVSGSSVRSYTLNIKNNCLDPNLQEPLLSAINNLAEPDRANHQNACKVTPSQPTGGGGGAGGKILIPDSCPKGDYSPSYYDGTCGKKPESHNAADEENTTVFPALGEYEIAYNRAKELGLTSKPTKEEARLQDVITRAEAAKIISVFATQLLKKEGDQTKQACKNFKDIESLNDELKGFVIQSCEFGIMGYHANGTEVRENFNPYDTLTRAEFGTMLSRVLWGNEHAGEEVSWYGNHLQALQSEGIMTKTSNPFQEETRGNVLLMLQRVPS